MSKSQELRWTMFIITAIGNFIAMLDSTTVNLALYPMSVDLGVNLSQIQWVMVGYMLILTVFLPFFGKLGDIFPKNKLYSVGFFIFAIGALFSFLSPNFWLLLFSRFIEATGASIMLSNAQALIATIFKDKNRGKALGLNGCLIAIGGMSGPAIGGLLINNFGWHSVFLPCIPFAVLGAYFAWKLLPSHTNKTENLKFDYKGFIYFTLSLVALLLAISQGYQWGWTSFRIIVLGIMALSFGSLFYVRERGINYPMIDFSIFRIKTFTFGNIAVMFSYMAMFTNSVLLPFYLMEILRYDAFTAGLLILPYSVTLSVVAPVSGNYAGKHGGRFLTLAGPIVFMTALAIFSTFDMSTKIWQIVVGSGIMGIGNGLFQSPSNNAIMTSVKESSFGIASGILALSRNMGHILGVAVTISLFEAIKHMSLLNYTNEYSTAFLNAYHTTMGFGIFFGLICLTFAYFAYKPSK